MRELENVIHRAAILCRGKFIETTHLPEELHKNQPTACAEFDKFLPSFSEAKKKIVEDFERRYLLQVLEECNGVISKAAERAGMHKKNFHEKMAKYGIRKQKAHFQE